MKHFKRIFSTILAALLALVLLTPAMQAVLGDNIHIANTGETTGIFEVQNDNGQWGPLTVPLWATVEGEGLAFCLESDKPKPTSDSYRIVYAFYDVYVRGGVEAILTQSAPDGLSPTAAKYATQVAIWAWMYESAGVGLACYAPGTLRPAAGSQPAYDFYLFLLDCARSGELGTGGGDPAKITWLESDGLQNMVVPNFTPPPTHVDDPYTPVIVFPGSLTIIKTIADGGDPSGFAFELKKGDTVIGTYTTDEEGRINVPSLSPGTYTLREINLPAGYTEPTDNDRQVVIIEKQNTVVEWTNTLIKGTITIVKQGEALAGAKEASTTWGKQLEPIYSIKALAGAEFDIVAAEDITTPDGTLRAQKGMIVDHIITGSDGRATSKALFLGSYYAAETKAPAGYVLSTTKHPVTLTPSAVTSQISVDNVRQKVEITLAKTMEKPMGAPDGFNPFADVVFGLYAAEGIGGIIPKDALMDTITLDAAGKGAFAGDLPHGKYYARELQTNDYYQLNEAKYPVDVTYAGQDVAFVKVRVNNGSAIPNVLKQGKIVVEKQGEVLVGATKTASGYVPIYELRGLPGATFDMIDSNGTIVDTIITGADGKAESKLLSLGSYEIMETAAPAGFVLDPERRVVTLGFDGQIEDVIIKQITVLNDRQKAEIRINKTWEMPDVLSKDFAPWEDITFGLCQGGHPRG